ncbi:thioesterase II family protein [Streptomyces sp. NPDC085946]|uniref:thioesterase II family protein n=1 Tax=Streptomyces sp. NPDC085946 TaxID=3365744 RepID=UPI0037D38522
MVGNNPWIRELRRTARPAAHVVFFPHAGGAATFFAPFTRHLPADFDVSAAQYPGRQERYGEPFVDTVEGLADHLAEALRPYAARPVTLVLVGHSMGARVAFETAARLTAAGPAAPCRLVVSGSPAPSTGPRDEVHRGTDQEILAHLAALGGTDAEILHRPELAQLFLPALRNDYGAVARYRPAERTVLDLPVLCLVGEQDPRATPEDAAVWKEHTSSDFALRTFPGGHFFLTEHRETVARLVTEWAESVPGGPVPPDGD